MKRRTWIKTTSLLSGAAFFLQRDARLLALTKDSLYKDTIGLQLWTVRNQMAEDKRKTLAAVAAAGYQQVELMDTADAKELLPICQDLGLKVTSAFFNWQTIANPTAQGVPTENAIIEQAKAANLKHLVFGYIGKGHRETADQFKRHAQASNKFGEKVKAAGMKLCYHNHSFEFKKLSAEKCGFDLLIDNFDPQLVPFELDVFWVAIGGWDPIETLHKLNGRVSQVHLKDLRQGTQTNFDEATVPNEAFQELGDGIIDMAAVLKVSAEIGVEQCHVEQDQSNDPIASVGQSIAHLKTL